MIEHDQVHKIAGVDLRYCDCECSRILTRLYRAEFRGGAFTTALSVTLLFGSAMALLYGSYNLLFRQPVVLPVKHIETHEDYVEALSFYRRIKVLEEDITLGLSQLSRIKRRKKPS